MQGDLTTSLAHNNTQQHYTTALGYIKLPMYQLFLWRLYLMVLRGATSLLGALEGVNPENIDFFGHKWHSLRLCHFRAQKSNDVAPLKTITYRARKTTGTIIVNIRSYTDNGLPPHPPTPPPILAGTVAGCLPESPDLLEKPREILENACIFNAKSINRNMRKIAQ
jgi:hypothetical protein